MEKWWSQRALSCCKHEVYTAKKSEANFDNPHELIMFSEWHAR